MGDVLRQCRAQTAEVYGADEEKTMKEKTALAFFSSSHLDLHSSLPGGLVFSNQPLIYGNIWRLAEVGHFSMQISLLGLVQCGPPRKKIYNMRSNVIVAFRIRSLSP